MAMSSFTVFFFTVVLKLFFFLKKKFKCENKDTRTARRTSKRKSHEKILKTDLSERMKVRVVGKESESFKEGNQESLRHFSHNSADVLKKIMLIFK